MLRLAQSPVQRTENLAEERTLTDWEQQFNQVVAHERGLLGAFISARVETVTGETWQPVEYLVSVESDERGSVLVPGRSPMPASASGPGKEDTSDTEMTEVPSVCGWLRRTAGPWASNRTATETATRVFRRCNSSIRWRRSTRPSGC
jgi:hypothetical protein